jgi:hypothetical protein
MTNWRRAQRKAAKTGKWAVTMTKVRIRKVLSKTRWQLVTFLGPAGSESAGIIDLIAIRKDHSRSPRGMKRGDALQIVLIQVKGGRAAKPSPEDVRRLRAVARRHHACEILLAIWEKGQEAHFLRLKQGRASRHPVWIPLQNIEAVFR